MPGVTRYGDLIVGYCNHGQLCCGHRWTGFHWQTAKRTTANGRRMTRFMDMSITNCPHCRVAYNVQATQRVIVESKPLTLRGHAVITPAGRGTCVMGSPNVVAR